MFSGGIKWENWSEIGQLNIKHLSIYIIILDIPNKIFSYWKKQ